MADEACGIRRLTIVQILPALDGGGVEGCTLEASKALVDRGHQSIVVSAGGRLVERLLAEGGQHVEMQVGKKSPLTLFKALTLSRLFRQVGADVVHARSRMPAWLVLCARRLTPAAERPQFLTTVHGLNSVSSYSQVMTYGERVVAVSQCCRDYVLQHYPRTNPDKVIVIPHGIDRDVYSYGCQPCPAWQAAWRRDFPQLVNRFVVLLPGRLTRLKGHVDFIAAIAQVKNSGVPVHGVIVGGEDPRRKTYAQQLRDEVRRAGLANDTTFTGHRSDLREIMSVASAVVSTSTKPESFGRTVLESLALGRPTLGYDHGGVGEILGQLYPAGRVPVGDVQALAGRMSEIFHGRLEAPAQFTGYDLRSALEQEVRLYEELAG